MTRSTTGRMTRSATDAGHCGRDVATDAVGAAERMLLAWGAFHAAIVTAADAIAATPAFLRNPLVMAENHL